MALKHSYFVLITLLLLASCSNPITSEREEMERVLREMEQEKRMHQETAKAKQAKIPKSVVASTNELDQQFCGYIMQLPTNKAQKETQLVLDSLNLFFQQHPNFDVNCGCSHGTTVKKFGAKLPLIKHFIRNKYRSGRDYVFQPIHLASSRGSDTVVKLLLSKNARLNMMDNNKKKPLNLGVLSLRPETVELMIHQGADPEGICLCGVEDLHRIDDLIKAGIDSSGVDVNGGLKTFFEDKNLDAYLKYNPDLSKCPIDIFFASERSDKTIRKLIKHGWSPFSKTLKSTKDYVIVDFTYSKDMKDETLVLMMENIRDSNIVLINQEHDGHYLLHKAIENDYPKMAAKLLELGADPEIINSKNLNAKDLAKGKAKMEELFN